LSIGPRRLAWLTGLFAYGLLISGSGTTIAATPDQGHWQHIAAKPRFYHTATLLPNGKVLVVGGCNKIRAGGELKDGCVTSAAEAEVLDPHSLRWAPAGRMATPRAFHSAASLPVGPESVCGKNCGKVLVSGGCPGLEMNESPGATGSGPGQTSCGAPRGIEKFIDINAPITKEERSELYDPKRNVWSLTSSSKSQFRGKPGGSPADTVYSGELGVATTFPVGPPSQCGDVCGKVLISGQTTNEIYDPKTESWSSTSNLDEVRPLSSFHVENILANGTVAAADAIRSYIFDPLRKAPAHIELGIRKEAQPSDLRGAWTFGASKHVGPDEFYTATALPDGTLLVAGGSLSDGKPTPATEIYDPAAPSTEKDNTDSQGATGTPAKGAFKPVGGLRVARTRHGAASVKDGKVLVVGGYGPAGKPISSAEIYDPVSRTWAAAGSMTRSMNHPDLYQPTINHRPSFTVTTLKDGRVLVLGGSTTGGAEIYTPAAYTSKTSLKQHNRVPWLLVAAIVALIGLGASVARGKLKRKRAV